MEASMGGDGECSALAKAWLPNWTATNVKASTEARRGEPMVRIVLAFFSFFFLVSCSFLPTVLFCSRLDG